MDTTQLLLPGKQQRFYSGFTWTCFLHYLNVCFVSENDEKTAVLLPTLVNICKETIFKSKSENRDILCIYASITSIMMAAELVLNTCLKSLLQRWHTVTGVEHVRNPSNYSPHFSVQQIVTDNRCCTYCTSPLCLPRSMFWVEELLKSVGGSEMAGVCVRERFTVLLTNS